MARGASGNHGRVEDDAPVAAGERDSVEYERRLGCSLRVALLALMVQVLLVARPSRRGCGTDFFFPPGLWLRTSGARLEAATCLTCFFVPG